MSEDTPAQPKKGGIKAKRMEHLYDVLDDDLEALVFTDSLGNETNRALLLIQIARGLRQGHWNIPPEEENAEETPES